MRVILIILITCINLTSFEADTTYAPSGYYFYSRSFPHWLNLEQKINKYVWFPEYNKYRLFIGDTMYYEFFGTGFTEIHLSKQKIKERK
jgi:hypothetical protein